MFLAAAAAGIYGLSPSVSFGDSGEFIASAATLAIPHAPGYPLYCLVSRSLGQLLPWASWAYAVNLGSALCAAGALALFFSAMRLAAGGLAAALAAALLGASPFWLHASVQAEVFALHGLCAAASLWVLCRYGPRFFDARPMAALGLCLGLGGANHHTLILAAPALFAGGFLAARPTARRAARGLAVLLAFGLLGLAVYLYLPIRARAGPPLDWGHPVDLPRFLHVLLRKDYGSFALTVEGPGGSRLAGIPAQAARYAGTLWREFGALGALLAAAGLAARARQGAGWIAPALWVLASGPGFLMLGNPPSDPQTAGALERFHLLSWLGVAWLAAYGAAELERRLGRRAALLLAVPLLAAPARTHAWSQRWDLAAHDYGRNLLRSLPPRASLFMDGGDDSFYTAAYFLFAERRRPDVEPHDRGGLVFPSAYGPDFRALPKTEKEPRRQAVEASLAAGRPLLYATLRDGLLPGYELALWGLLRRAVAGPESPSHAPREAPEGRALWELYPVRLDPARARSYYRYRALVPVYPYLRAWAAAARGEPAAVLRHLEEAARLGPDVGWVRDMSSQRAQWAGYAASGREDWEGAERAYRLAERLKPEDARIRLNIGVALEKRGRRADAMALYEAVVRELPGEFQARYNLGALYWEEGRWREAADALEAAARISPADERARRFAELARARAGS